MAVVDRISPSDWLVVWKKQSDARVGRAVAEPEGGVRADCRGCNGTTRLLLPLSAEGGLAGRRGKLLVGLQLRVDKVSPARPVEWVALLSGPTPDDLNFVKKLESLPVMGAKGRSWSWELPLEELEMGEGELYLAVQFAPRSQATSLSGSLMLEAAEAPPPEAPPEPALSLIHI